MPAGSTWINYAVPVTDNGPDGTPGGGDDTAINYAQDITGSTLTNIHADATEVTNAKWNEVATWGRNNGYTNLQDTCQRRQPAGQRHLLGCLALVQRPFREGRSDARLLHGLERGVAGHQPKRNHRSRRVLRLGWERPIFPRFGYCLPGRFEHSQLRKIYQRSGSRNFQDFLPIKMDANGYRLTKPFHFFQTCHRWKPSEKMAMG